MCVRERERELTKLNYIVCMFLNINKLPRVMSVIVYQCNILRNQIITYPGEESKMVLERNSFVLIYVGK